MNDHESKWIVMYKSKDDYSTYRYGCKVCENEPLRDINGRVILSPYCPYCGRKMVKE